MEKINCDAKDIEKDIFGIKKGGYISEDFINLT